MKLKETNPVLKKLKEKNHRRILASEMRAFGGLDMVKAEWMFPVGVEPKSVSPQRLDVQPLGGGVVLRFPAERMRRGHNGLAEGCVVLHPSATHAWRWRHRRAGQRA